MNQYAKSEWKQFRDEVIELDKFSCKDCGRGADDVILQVHHKVYIPGRKPWEYPLKDCETLCKGCHAAKHGIIRPQVGWTYVCQEDLGDLIGTCEICGSSIRHTFLISHPNWRPMEVGTICCDKLTDSNIASNLIESQTSYKSRKDRFINSIRWIELNGVYSITQSHFKVEIKTNNGGFIINIHEQLSKVKYNSLMEAKAKVFDVIESGEFIKYLEKHNIPFKQKGKNKTLNEPFK